MYTGLAVQRERSKQQQCCCTRAWCLHVTKLQGKRISRVLDPDALVSRCMREKGRRVLIFASSKLTGSPFEHSIWDSGMKFTERNRTAVPSGPSCQSMYRWDPGLSSDSFLRTGISLSLSLWIQKESTSWARNTHRHFLHFVFFFHCQLSLGASCPSLSP